MKQSGHPFIPAAGAAKSSKSRNICAILCFVTCLNALKRDNDDDCMAANLTKVLGESDSFTLKAATAMSWTVPPPPHPSQHILYLDPPNLQ